MLHCNTGSPMRQLVVTFPDRLMNGQLDDYGHTKDAIWLAIKDTGVEVYNLILLVHGLVEYILTQGRGLPLQLIDRFDEAHPDSEEPGDEVNSPYRNEHGIALGIERILCAYLNIPWKVYEEALLKALGDDQ